MGRYPIIVVISGFTGNNEHHKDVVRRFAHAGFYAPAADVKRFEADLKKKNSNVEFVLYPGAPHRFFSDDSPQVYKKDAAEDGWKRCVAFFTKHLKA